MCRWVAAMFLVTFAVFGWRDFAFVCPVGHPCPAAESERAVEEPWLKSYQSQKVCMQHAQDKGANMERWGWNYRYRDTEGRERQVRWRFVCQQREP